GLGPPALQDRGHACRRSHPDMMDPRPRPLESLPDLPVEAPLDALSLSEPGLGGRAGGQSAAAPPRPQVPSTEELVDPEQLLLATEEWPAPRPAAAVADAPASPPAPTALSEPLPVAPAATPIRGKASSPSRIAVQPSTAAIAGMPATTSFPAASPPAASPHASRVPTASRSVASAPAV